MTISTTQSRVQHLGNGVTVTFAVPFRTLTAAHLTVTQMLVDGTASTPGFTGVGLDADAGGAIRLAAAPPVGSVLTIQRLLPAVQQTDYVEGDPFPAQSHERALDYLTMLAQQQQDGLGRAILLPATDTTPNVPLPPQDQRVGKALIFGADGEPTLSQYDFDMVAGEVAATADSAEGSAAAAAGSAAAAADSASAAAGSTAAAAAAAAAVGVSANRARQWAEMTDGPVEAPNGFSAKHWAGQASLSDSTGLANRLDNAVLWGPVLVFR